MFGVIICPKCHRARGVSLSAKKVKCPHCGRTIDVSMAKVYHRTEDQEELVLAVQKMTERLAVSIEDYPAERKRRGKVAPKECKTKSSEQDLRALAIELTEQKGQFTLEDLMAETGASADKASLLLEKMRSAGLVFETSPDRFKAL
jgi:rRNA maturation protein Nop10